MTGAEVELVEELPRHAQRAIVFWRHNPMLPVSYIDNKTGLPDVEGMQRAARILVRLGQDVEATLGDTFNIKGNIGFKADLQRALLALVPGYAMEFLEVDSEHVTARIHRPNGGWSPPLTKRITDTDIVNYAKTNADNYEKKPNRMLEARVTTELIDLYAKGVIRGLVRAQAGDAAPYFTDQGEEAAGELDSGKVRNNTEPSSPTVIPRSIDPTGATIPEHLREPEVDADVRADLIARITELDDDTTGDLLEVCKNLKLPNLRTPRFTRAHGALLSRLIAEAIDRHEWRHADPETGEVYAPDDPARPF